MKHDVPDFAALYARERRRLGREGALRLLDAGRAWDLAPTLLQGGSLLFPHASIGTCGAQTAAAVHAALDCGAGRVVVLGVLHARTPELEQARARVAAGADITGEPAWGLQGPGLAGRQDWRDEFSLDSFLFLWEQETRRRGVAGPELVLRYPYLVGGRPAILPGIAALQELARDAAVIATMDPFHHGIAYDDPPTAALHPEAGGLDLARRRIEEGLVLLRAGDYWGYHQHCVAAKSDGRDVGQVLRYLRGPLQGRILDLAADDMTAYYGAPGPSWVACALIELRPAAAAP